MKRTVIIMAGGSGERFWPLSRKNTPKQLLKLGNNDKTMLTEAIERVLDLVENEDIFIITGEHLLEPIRKELKEIPMQNIIAEPNKRNTAPCLALGAAFIKAKYKDIPENEISIAVLTADHIISPQDKFVENLDIAFDYVANNNNLCTLGIPPIRTETGYGYIELSNEISTFSSDNVQKVISFREKPNYKKASEYIESKKFLWNSGMFFWRLDVFINEMTNAIPEIGQKIESMSEKYNGNTEKSFNSYFEGVADIFDAFPNISIDYALMERSKNVAVIKAMFDWDDCGSWDSLERTMDKDSNNNILQGDTVVLKSNNSIIVNASKKDSFLLTTYGIDNLAIIVTDDAAVICPKNKVQEVKEIVNKIKKIEKNKFL